jgi:hypothetical protein
MLEFGDVIFSIDSLDDVMTLIPKLAFSLALFMCDFLINILKFNIKV